MMSQEFENMEREYSKCPMSAVPYAPERFTEWLVGHEHKSHQTANIYISSLRTVTKEHFREAFWHLHYNVWEAFETIPDKDDESLEDYFINQLDARYWLEEFLDSVNFSRECVKEFPIDEDGNKDYSRHTIENQELALKAYYRFLEFLTFENLQKYAPYDKWPRDKWIDFERKIKCNTFYVPSSWKTDDEIDRIAVEPFESIKKGNKSKYAETVRLARKEDFRNWLLAQKYSKPSVSTYLTNLLRLITEFGIQTLEKEDWIVLTKSEDTVKMLRAAQTLENKIDSSMNSSTKSVISKNELSKGKTSLTKYILFLKDCLRKELK